MKRSDKEEQELNESETTDQNLKVCNMGVGPLSRDPKIGLARRREDR